MAFRGKVLLSSLGLVLAISLVYSYIGTASAIEVELAEGMIRSDVSNTIGSALGWSEAEKAEFSSTHAQMQWAAWNADLRSIFDEMFVWSGDEEEAFLVSSSLQFSGPEQDILSSVYKPGTYTFARNDSKATIAAALIDPVSSLEGTQKKEFIRSHISIAAAQKVDAFVAKSLELLPDLVPAPAEDLKIETNEKGTFLRFSTIYYNQGRGPLELLADPATRGRREDLVRKVFQRIYKKDGSFRDKVSGTFLWHQEHLHYHFSDFIVYDLEAVSTEGTAPDLSGVRTKSTFCIRDISRTNQVLEYRDTEARYRICGKEKQGISVGWGDSYFFNYPDQILNISDLPKGTYKLTFLVNPENLFEEDRTDNNKSSVTFAYDPAAKTVSIVSKDPTTSPKLEHIYLEQDL